jgi:hypothetical protein
MKEEKALKTCPYCDGTGRNNLYGGKFECDGCDGTAKVPDGLPRSSYNSCKTVAFQ